MINIKNLTGADVGRLVIYNPVHTEIGLQGGIITSFNDRYVFVRYDGSDIEKNGVATYPNDLTFLSDIFPNYYTR